MMLVAAHRGASGHAPENTMAAFHAAVAARADLIELDVRFTRDLVPVVIHDRTLARTAGGRGAVAARTFAELSRHDAGTWFHPRFAGQRVPALATVLCEIPPAIGINIEVKPDGDQRPFSELAARLREELRANRGSRRIMVSSFDHRFLKAYRHWAPRDPVGILLHPVRDLVRRPVHIARRLDAAYILCSRSLVRRSMVDAAHEEGCGVGVYTVNHTDMLPRLARYGVDLVFTNFPAEIRAALERD
jgi:glycerophosphoryl diester phosphodiesterase